MSHDSILAVSRQGLDIERARLEAAARAIEMANTPIPPSQASRAEAGFGAKVHSTDRKVHDPTNPMADASGMVHYPAIDLAAEMSTLISASRAYEANVRAFNVLRSMQLEALNIGESQP
jgi:flagellar basal-body rod protein FlgC